MSNGDDVLDNWEEIDDAVLNSAIKPLSESSEGIAHKSVSTSVTTKSTTLYSHTEMRVLEDSTSQVTDAKASPLDNMSASFQPVMMVLHKPQDDYQCANYTAPIANQTVKILRRPTQSTEIRNNGIRPKQPIKTLQQREQEYAEARLRILGSAKNPDDDEQRAETAPATSVVTNTTPSAPSTQATTIVSLSNNSSANVVPTTKSTSSRIQLGNQYSNHYNQQQQQKYPQIYQQQQQQQQTNYFYNQQQQPQSPAYNNNRTYNMNPLLAVGPMGPIGQPAQYQNSTLVSQQTPQQHMKYLQYNRKSPQQQHKSQQQQQQTWSPVVGGSVSSSSTRQQQQDTILRLPRGPDGSTGFQMHR